MTTAILLVALAAGIYLLLAYAKASGAAAERERAAAVDRAADRRAAQELARNVTPEDLRKDFQQGSF